ncbi:hypothetical protein LINPERPRIM_LOCUS16399, partial [Linum perenne]
PCKCAEHHYNYQIATNNLIYSYIVWIRNIYYTNEKVVSVLLVLKIPIPPFHFLLGMLCHHHLDTFVQIQLDLCNVLEAANDSARFIYKLVISKIRNLNFLLDKSSNSMSEIAAFLCTQAVRCMAGRRVRGGRSRRRLLGVVDGIVVFYSRGCGFIPI